MRHIVRPQQHFHPAAGGKAVRAQAARLAQLDADAGVGAHFARQQHALADKIRHHAVGRLVVQIVRAVPLHDAALLHHPHLVGHGEGFVLVVGDQNRRGLRRLEDVAHFLAQPLAQRHIQIGKRLVQQQQARLRGQRPRQRHPLLLAAGQFMRVALRQAIQANQRQHARHLRRAGVARQRIQAKADIAGHGQVREQTIILKHHADLALVRRGVQAGVGQQLAINQDAPAAERLKAGNAAQHGGFAAAGAAQQAADFAALQRQGQLFHHAVASVALADGVQLQ